MPLSLGNLGSSFGLQAEAPLTSRSVCLCSAMAAIDDLFADDGVGMDMDDSEDEVDDIEQPILPVGAAGAVFPQRISLSSLWQGASDISPAETTDLAICHGASSSSSLPQNASQCRVGLQSDPLSRTPSAQSPCGKISLAMIFPSAREQILTWHPNRLFFAITLLLYQRMSQKFPVRRRCRGKQSSSMEILKTWMAGRFPTASRTYRYEHRSGGRDFYERSVSVLTGRTTRVVKTLCRRLWEDLRVESKNSWGELAELLKREEVRNCAEEFASRPRRSRLGTLQDRETEVEDVDKAAIRGYGVSLCFNTSVGQDDVQVIRILQSGLSGQELRSALAEVDCYSKFIDDCWAYFSVLGKENGFPLVACGMEHSVNGSHPARVHVHVYMGMEIRGASFAKQFPMVSIAIDKLIWNGLKPGFMTPTVVLRRAHAHICKAVIQAYYYVAGPKNTQMLLRCSAQIHKEHEQPAGNTLHIFTDLLNAFRSNFVRFVFVAIQIKKSRFVENGGCLLVA